MAETTLRESGAARPSLPDVAQEHRRVDSRAGRRRTVRAGCHQVAWSVWARSRCFTRWAIPHSARAGLKHHVLRRARRAPDQAGTERPDLSACASAWPTTSWPPSRKLALDPADHAGRRRDGLERHRPDGHAHPPDGTALSAPGAPDYLAIPRIYAERVPSRTARRRKRHPDRAAASDGPEDARDVAGDVPERRGPVAVNAGSCRSGSRAAPSRRCRSSTSASTKHTDTWRPR